MASLRAGINAIGRARDANQQDALAADEGHAFDDHVGGGPPVAGVSLRHGRVRRGSHHKRHEGDESTEAQVASHVSR